MKEMLWKNRRILSIGLVIIVITVVFGCSRKTTGMQHQLWGRADAKEIDINSKVAGRVVKLLVTDGDKVKKGQILAYMDKRDLVAQKNQLEANIEALKVQENQAMVQTSLVKGTSNATMGTAQAQLQSAQADMALAKTNYKRFSALVNTGAVSQQTFDTYKTKYQAAQAAYEQALAGVNKADSGLLQANVEKVNEKVIDKKIEQAQAALQQLEVQLGEAVIKAPFDGVITEKYVEEGSMISLGTPLLAIQDPSDNWVNFKVPETDLAEFHLQQKVELIGRDNKTKIQGIVTDISKKAEFATQRATSERGDSTDIISFNVKVQVNSNKLWPGMRFRLFNGEK
ncbi:HlyD family secretion protein [Pectinatus sottacetonis]|uniref:HlyD family secretion protein n=1 Tax=Pectinatus sottacetonis TaxID=1002795 RepID=UPI0018C56D81|nr:efflux RND transporter periplasmic adaptor subunit [Pectinatus sottacetonis]